MAGQALSNQGFLWAHETVADERIKGPRHQRGTVGRDIDERWKMCYVLYLPTSNNGIRDVPTTV